MGSTANTSELRKDMDPLLKSDLPIVHVDVPMFEETFFRNIEGLKEKSEAIFNQCRRGSDSLYREGWSGWPQGAPEKAVLAWLDELILKFSQLMLRNNITIPARRLMTRPNDYLVGPTSA